MKKPDQRIYLIPLLLFCVILFSGCGRQPEIAVTPTPTVSATGTLTVSETDTPSPGTSDTDQAISEIPGLEVVATLAEAAPTRTPEPTATPDAIAEAAEAVAQETGLTDTTLLGLSIVNWFNLGGSLLLVLAAYLLGTWMIRWLLPRLVARTKTDLDDRLLQVAGNDLRWLVVVLILRFATARLVFIGPRTQTFLGDVYFLLILLLSLIILWRLINLVAEELGKWAKKTGNQREAQSLIILIVWGLRLIVLIIALPITLNHFGIDVTGFTVLLGIIALAISLAGRDVLADIIAGALILVDRPYRVGDRVGLGDIDMWGDVVEIGMISTKVLTVDSRVVTVPNSKVRQNNIVNFSYPDPSYYDTTDIGVAFDNDVEKVEQLLKSAAGSVEGVQKERGIDVRLETFTRDEMIFRVGWWMKDNDDYYKLRQFVNRAIVKTFKQAGVTFPYQREQVELETNSDRSEVPGKSNQDK
jgi:small-conductance mechanosensitive channel